MDFSGIKNVGILGGGQLARMLAEAARNLGLTPWVLTGSQGDPAGQVGARLEKGDWKSAQDLQKFLPLVDLVAFESEFVPVETLRAALEEVSRRPQVLPGLDLMARLADKLEQKKILQDLGIDSAGHLALESGADPGAWMEEVKRRFPGGWVLKWARLGYDGKGTWISGGARPGDEMEFCRRALERGVGLFAERKVDFRRELAVVGFAGAGGRAPGHFPLVVSRQTDGICHWVFGPATALGVDEGLQRKAAGYVEKLAKGLGLPGCFAVEMFETEGGGLLVNELAPRVHNTGHYSLDACATSQFENHWRGLLDLDFGAVAPAPFFGMLNLVAPPRARVADPAPVPPEPPRGGRLYWYGKRECRPGRKMGHVNFTARSLEEFEGLRRSFEDYDARWRRLCVEGG